MFKTPLCNPDIFSLDRNELIGKSYKGLFSLKSLPTVWRIQLKAYYKALDRLRADEYKRINEKTYDLKLTKYYDECGLDKIKYIASLRLNNQGIIIGFRYE